MTKAVLEALLQLSRQDAAAVQGAPHPPACCQARPGEDGQAVSNAPDVLCAGRYAGWRTPLSYLGMNTMMSGLGHIQNGSCIRSADTYDAIVCPQHSVKVAAPLPRLRHAMLCHAAAAPEPLPVLLSDGGRPCLRGGHATSCHGSRWRRSVTRRRRRTAGTAAPRATSASAAPAPGCPSSRCEPPPAAAACDECRCSICSAT